MGWCYQKPQTMSKEGGESMAEQGWGKDRTMMMTNSLKAHQVKISSLIMEVINLVNKYKWKTYNLLDKKHT